MSESHASTTPTKRTVMLHFRASEEEKALIEQRAVEAAVRRGKPVKLSAYLREAALAQQEAA